MIRPAPIAQVLIVIFHSISNERLQQLRHRLRRRNERDMIRLNLRHRRLPPTMLLQRCDHRILYLWGHSIVFCALDICTREVAVQ